MMSPSHDVNTFSAHEADVDIQRVVTALLPAANLSVNCLTLILIIVLNLDLLLVT